MELKNKMLPEWLKTAPASLYPHNKKVDHYTHYKKLKDYLYDNVHKEVTSGANLKDPDIMLNDHGPDHIETVVKRATCLLDGSNCILSPYEVYILLCCIELHDVGNIFGRTNHESKAVDIIIQAEGICGRDTIEAITIRKIAEAHGGKLSNGSKDKIQDLEVTENPFHGTIRPRLIASILRFADELADDKTRANILQLNKGLIPAKSEVFHAYAMCLQSVKVDQSEHSIELEFQIPRKFLSRTFGKMGKRVLLINEIYDRLLKMHHEKIYCMSFCRGLIDIDNIRVHIGFYDDKLSSDFIPKMIFYVRDSGYPTSKKNIFDICPELVENGIKKDGKFFKKISKK